MRVELTGDASAFHARGWGDLVAADPEGTFFHTPAYLKLWWEEFGTGTPLMTFVVSEEGKLVGACPFEVVEGTLLFMGGFDVTDYMGPVSLPGLEEVVANELMKALEFQVRWERADLRGLPIDGRWLGTFEAAATARGFEVRRGIDGVAPSIELPHEFETYLDGLPAKLRHEIKRKERRLIEEAGPYRITISTPETLESDLDRFIDLHKASPGPKGKFMHAGMEIFFRRLTESFLATNHLNLAFIEIDGKKAAGAIAFAFGNTFSLYNSAFDREYSRLSPGMVLVSDLVRRSIELGRRHFDMLKGDLEYKYRFGAEPREVGKLEVTRSGDIQR
jgi:CelD/BcsL family acetyltransferase involved in cellulose biosynthesis